MTLHEVIILTFAYYHPERNLPDSIVKMYATDLADLPETEVIAAYHAWRRDSKNRKFPLPAEIRELFAPKSNPIDEAREAATRIVGAIRKFGWPNPEQAREFIGELGWEIVRLQGGWKRVCETTMENDISTLTAQCRDLAHSVSNRIAAGSYHMPPALPEARSFIASLDEMKRKHEIAMKDLQKKTLLTTHRPEDDGPEAA